MAMRKISLNELSAKVYYAGKSFDIKKPVKQRPSGSVH